MNKYIISLIVLFPVLLFGYSDSCKIEGIPYSTQSNVYYYLTKDIYSGESGIKIGNCDSVCVDLGGHTLYFSGPYGIKIDSGTNIIIKNGAIVYTGNLSLNNCIQIQTNGSNLLIENVVMIIDSLNGKCIEISGNPKNVEIEIGRPCGDVNLDGVTNVSDIGYLINYVFSGGPPPCKPE